MLFEVGCKHLLHEFYSKNSFTIVLHLVSLLGLHLIMEPLGAHVFLGALFFITWVYY